LCRPNYYSFRNATITIDEAVAKCGALQDTGSCSDESLCNWANDDIGRISELEW